MVLLAVFCFSIIGCGRSYKDREAQVKAEIEARLHKKEQAESELLEQMKQIAAKFNPVSFPGKDISPQAFTYELQHFFRQHTGRAILFRACIEDVEETEDGILAEFTCPVGDYPQSTVSFHLKANPDQAEALLSKRRQYSFYTTRCFFDGDSDYFIGARVSNIGRARRYEFRGSTYSEEELELSVEAPPRFVALGDLIEAISPPKVDDETKTKR
jgi:hypothetical protein